MSGEGEKDWECLSSTKAEFKFFSTSANFSEAVDLCKDESGSLARISSSEEFSFVQDLVANIEVPSNNFYIGVVDSEGVGGFGTERFSYVDGFQDSSFFATPKEFPWDATQPNDPDFTEAQLCVRFVKFLSIEGFNIQNRWVDEDCSQRRPFLCRRSCGEDDSTNVATIVFGGLLAIVSVGIITVSVLFLRKASQIKEINQSLDECKPVIGPIEDDQMIAKL